VPNTVDRIAQTAAAKLLEEKLEPIFHQDSYGYRPGRSAHDALAVTRKRCWKQDWILDLDVRAFFDSVPHDLMLKAVAHHTKERWVLLYVERWLKAPMQMADGTLVAREKGTPQGSLCSAAHNPPYEQYRVMRSVGLSGLVRTGSAAVRYA
jgi:retron-type reverse transcriptase